jgi:hypothetical protein
MPPEMIFESENTGKRYKMQPGNKKITTFNVLYNSDHIF